MTAKERAQSAFNAMADDPNIWLTHGIPSPAKEQHIVAVIAAAINDAIAAESFRDVTKALINMENAR